MRRARSSRLFYPRKRRASPARFLPIFLRWLILIFGVLLLYNTLFPPISTLMMARTLTLRPVARDFVPLARISPHLTRAVIAAEDGRFCDHHGVDWQALRGAVAEVMDLDSDRSHGASTLTMQTVKNLFLWHNFSYLRKPVEVPLALFLDAVWSKRRIMETYLSTAEFGAGIFGAEAAARHYFGISAAALSPWQSALLAATLPNPVQRNPARPSAYLANYAENISARVRRGVASACVR
jgi:monofunctional biosynthetic peptidoglycan transglycosylase